MIATVCQHAFATALLVPGMGVPAGLVGGSRTAHANERDREHARRFAVHRNNVVVGLVEALAATFPVCQALVGEEFFRAMARERVLADPPSSPILTDYAEGFADFVAGFAPAASVVYLADVARIEALRVRAFHAADAAPVAQPRYHELLAAPGALAAARVTLHPACHWLRSDHAAHAIWLAHQGLEDPSGADLDGIDVDHGGEVLVARPGFDVVVTAMPRGGADFLDALRAGHTLAAAFAAAQALAHASVQIDNVGLFNLLIQQGLAIGLDAPLEP